MRKNDEKQNITEESANAQPVEEKVSEVSQTAETDPENMQVADTDVQGKANKNRREQEAEEALKHLDSTPVQAPKKKRFQWLSMLFLFAAIALGIWLMFNIVSDVGDEGKSFGEVIKNSDYRFAIVTLVLLLVILFCEWMKYAVIMKTTTGKLNLRTCSKVAFLGKYYDNVTPFAAGGQPMQIYYLHKKGYSGGVSSAVVLIKYFAQMFCWTLVCLILMACNTGVLSQLGNSAWELTIMIGAWIGLAVNMFLPIMIVLFALLPKLSRALTSGVVKLGAKVKIVKDKEKAMTRAQKTVGDFRAAFRIMAHKPLNFLLLLFFCFTEVLLGFALPYFVMRTFNVPLSETGINAMFSVMALNVYAAQSVTVIPTPGNSGAIEAVVTKAFSAVVLNSVVTWVVVVWRFAVYYIYIIIGLCLTVYELIRKFYRARKAKRKEMAELFKIYGEHKERRLKEPEDTRLYADDGCISKEELSEIVALADLKAVKAKLAQIGYVNCEKNKAYKNLKLTDVANGTMFNRTQEFADAKNNYIYSGGVIAAVGSDIPEYIVIEIDKVNRKDKSAAIERLLVYAKDKKDGKEETEIKPDETGDGSVQ